MKKLCFLLELILIMLLTGCKANSMEKKYTDIMINALRFIRENPTFGFSEEQMLNRNFYHAITWYESRLDNVKECLENGCDPNYCYGECGWVESNPLMYLSQGTYTTYYRIIDGDDIPNPTPDVQLLLLLLEKGANIHYYPYIYAIVHRNNNTKNKVGDLLYSYIADCNRILKAFLDNGADVNKKGHPYPFSYEYSYESLKLLPEDAYEDVYKYFNSPEATTPLYEAIKKGIVWESQVDLLLEYGATLDESCLEAARLSGDEAMVEKINKLWTQR